jgi:hypothetical protein
MDSAKGLLTHLEPQYAPENTLIKLFYATKINLKKILLGDAKRNNVAKCCFQHSAVFFLPIVGFGICVEEEFISFLIIFFKPVLWISLKLFSKFICILTLSLIVMHYLMDLWCDRTT